MTEYVRGFIVTDVVETHRHFQQAIREAGQLVEMERKARVNVGAKQFLDELNRTYSTFNSNLRGVADKAATDATRGMVERLESQRRRPETGSIPPLKDLIAATPLAPILGLQTAAVGIANVAFLNRAINPHSRGYGPYWRAIEYGTGQGRVPSQLGRILYGTFQSAGGGDRAAPNPAFSGGGGPHPVFVQGRDPAAGFGTVAHEIQGKHFIEWGADSARIQWRTDLARMQDRAIDELKALKLVPVAWRA